MKYFYLTISLFFLDGLAKAENLGQVYYGKGYTIVNETPIRNADLKQVVNKRIVARTIQEGLQNLLNNTGWRLSGLVANNPQILSLYNAPWPEHWTFLGPDQLDNILTTIGGEGWQLIVDPVNRLIGYEVKPQFTRGRH